MKVIIIGSSGFIGSNLEIYLSEKAYEVYSCDIIEKKCNAKFTLLDKINPDYKSLFMKNKFDICINCSGAASVPYSFENTIYDFELNSFNVVKILDSIKVYNPECKFINLSSAAVYGNPMVLPVSESNELLPISPYGYHKVIAEKILYEYYKLWNIRTCSVRIFSAYGNGLKKQLLFDISKKILLEKEIHLYGTGEESRDFIHIDDICQAIDCIIKGDSFQSTQVNIANGKQITVNELVEIFNKNWVHNKNVIFDGIERIGDPNKWIADITILRSYGYRQSISIEDGIKRYINWIKNEKLE
ncbi:NAD-dependent epimerase/dehydratase family protein [Treponema primitia]|uniref:NAD-dependent epimerase/dehydratase family protein n=1 Tax=Treponema primitia TaxID=88058 RepID=UPI0002555602|nr:NAD-dependent epimerase/dehydratase family protein [Treponema primitia]